MIRYKDSNFPFVVLMLIKLLGPTHIFVWHVSFLGWILLCLLFPSIIREPHRCRSCCMWTRVRNPPWSIPGYTVFCQKPISIRHPSPVPAVKSQAKFLHIVFYMAMVARHIFVHQTMYTYINLTILLACTRLLVCHFPMIIKSVCFPFEYQRAASRLQFIFGDSTYTIKTKASNVTHIWSSAGFL